MSTIPSINGRHQRLPVIIVSAFAGVLALFLLILSGCGSSATVTADTGGRIQIAETSFDFGSVPVEQKVEHEFEVKNVGTGELQMGQLDVKRLEGC
jgi:hypothetical protein